jgi:hypothetical protein
MTGWRLLVDPTPGIAIDDPVGVQFTFVRFNRGKIVERGPCLSGFCHAPARDIRELLETWLSALDEPWIREDITTEYVELK